MIKIYSQNANITQNSELKTINETLQITKMHTS